MALHRSPKGVVGDKGSRGKKDDESVKVHGAIEKTTDAPRARSVAPLALDECGVLPKVTIDKESD